MRLLRPGADARGAGAGVLGRRNLILLQEGLISTPFDIYRCFTTQIEAHCMPYMLVLVRGMPRDGYTTDLTQL